MAFQQGLSGLSAAAKNLDVISNNVANAGTVGYKNSNVQFADVYATSLSGAGALEVGIGVNVAAIAQQFTQGNISGTNNPLDMAINGAGFFRMSNEGSITYTRNGQFFVDRDGYIVNAGGLRLTGYAADPITNTVVPSSPVDLKVSQQGIPTNPTTAVGVSLNLDSRNTQPVLSPFAPNNAQSFNSSTAVTTYDSLGNPHTFSMYFVKTATANNWDMYTTLDGVTPASGPDRIIFNTAGQLDAAAMAPTDPALLAQSFPITTGATTTFDFNLDLTGSSQVGTGFGVTAMTQDGYAPGRLVGVSVSPDGMVQQRFSNGQSRNLGQVVLANFPNLNGLESQGGNQWAESYASGPPAVGAPTTGNLGVLQAGAVEDSNVDLTAELVSMITAQRNYQANAQSIRAQDQIMQTIVNLR